MIVTSYIHTSLHTYIMNIIKGHRDYSKCSAEVALHLVSLSVLGGDEVTTETSLHRYLVKCAVMSVWNQTYSLSHPTN